MRDGAACASMAPHVPRGAAARQRGAVPCTGSLPGGETARASRRLGFTRRCRASSCAENPHPDASGGKPQRAPPCWTKADPAREARGFAGPFFQAQGKKNRIIFIIADHGENSVKTFQYRRGGDQDAVFDRAGRPVIGCILGFYCVIICLAQGRDILVGPGRGIHNKI